MKTFYTEEKHIQILLSLLKKNNIKKVIASPGTQNISLVMSMQNDSFFEVYSAADERSAAYIACGLSVESGEPVVLSCTGATASRNYVPGLTEAFYRKIPILTITSTQPEKMVGHNIPQVIDRRIQLNDICKMSIYLSRINNPLDKWNCEVQINKAIIELTRHGGGPVHINLEAGENDSFSIEKLPDARTIKYINNNEDFPEISGKKVGIYVGAHKKWDKELTEIVDRFCEQYNAIVFCDQTSNYKGKYRALVALVAMQEQYTSPCCSVDVLLHIGDISGAYVTIESKETWRINPDGEIRDTFKNLKYVFEMEEKVFFDYYVNKKRDLLQKNTFFEEWNNEYNNILNNIAEIPFSNPWIAKQSANKLPNKSVLHLGILNSLRSWNYFETPRDVLGYANTGGFGIDGNISSLIGASLSNPNKLFFGIVGDLAFFYDMNSLGNHHVGKNIRIMLINNGRGTEFRIYSHPAAVFEEATDSYVAAAGHYGNKSSLLVKHYAQDLGFEYISAKNKEEYLSQMDKFFNSNIGEKPILFEIFTNSKDESDAHKIIRNTMISKKIVAKKMTKQIVKRILGKKGINFAKKIINNR